MVSKEWNTSFRHMRERLTDTKEGRSTHRVSIWVWTRDVETCSWSQEWFEREGLMGERGTPEFYQTSFLRIENSDAEFGFKFDKWSHVINVPFNKTLFLEFVSKKIRTGSLFVRTVSRLSNQTTLIINMGELGKIGRRNSLSLIFPPPVHLSKVWTDLIFDT